MGRPVTKAPDGSIEFPSPLPRWLGVFFARNHDNGENLGSSSAAGVGAAPPTDTGTSFFGKQNNNSVQPAHAESLFGRRNPMIVPGGVEPLRPLPTPAASSMFPSTSSTAPPAASGLFGGGGGHLGGGLQPFPGAQQHPQPQQPSLIEDVEMPPAPEDPPPKPQDKIWKVDPVCYDWRDKGCCRNSKCRWAHYFPEGYDQEFWKRRAEQQRAVGPAKGPKKGGKKGKGKGCKPVDQNPFRL